MNKKIKISIFLLMSMIVFAYIENNCITINEIEIENKKIPTGFNGYKIVHLSDLHNKSFGKDQKTLIRKIEKINPDLVVITGDIIDSRRYDEKPSLKLVEEISKTYPVYYVSGNHEMRSGKFPDLEVKLKKEGATVLRNEGKILKSGQDEIMILGIDDPTLFKKKESVVVDYEIKKAIKSNNNKYKILLSHRPEKFPVYINNKIDLSFCGHAHGGQVRLPLIGGIIAPNQGWFPKYTSGKYEDGISSMVVSRGLGNSRAPLRVFNRPEIVVVTLYNKK